MNLTVIIAIGVALGCAAGAVHARKRTDRIVEQGVRESWETEMHLMEIYAGAGRLSAEETDQTLASLRSTQDRRAAEHRQQLQAIDNSKRAERAWALAARGALFLALGLLIGAALHSR